MQELNKTIDINFKVGMPQWVLAQPFWYPLTLSCLFITGVGWLFGDFGLITGIIISLVISTLIILMGIESKGITLFSLIRSFFNYQFSKKILLKKEVSQRTENIMNNCIVTKDYIYNKASVNSQEFGDVTDKDAFDNDLQALVNIASKDYLTYTIKTELSEMSKEDITDYLEYMKQGLPERLNGAYLAFAQDLSNLVESGEFNQVKSEMTLSLPTDRKESLNLHVKTLNNELQLLERRSLSSKISIKQKLLNHK
jgi:hypothetical protein